MARWYPLTEYLCSREDDVVILTYDQIAAILGDALPASASKHRPVFWSNAIKGAYSRHWRDAGFRTRLRGLNDDEIRFVREGTVGPLVVGPHAAEASPVRGMATGVADVILVGCVKTKADSPRPARALYTSQLFAKRRAYAESSRKAWVILSAAFGVVQPEQIIAPYDTFLEDQSAAYRREWGRRVVEQLTQSFGTLDGLVFELHAGAAYGDPIEAGLKESGAILLRPLVGARIGQHLAWYDANDSVPLVPLPPPRLTSGPESSARSEATASDERQGLALRITRAFTGGELDLSQRGPGAPVPSWSSMPEVVAVRHIRERGATAADVRRFCTFMSAMNRARDADVLWKRGVVLHEHEPWVFQPNSVVERRLTTLGDALRSAGVSQRHGVDVAAWRTIAESLVDESQGGPVHQAIEAGTGRATELLQAVQATTAQGGDHYPLLRGPKIRVVWVRMLAYPGGAEIADIDALPVAVDTQVRKVTEHLGVIATAGKSVQETRSEVVDAWREQVHQHGAIGPGSLSDTAAALDAALWFWGKWGCTFCERANSKMPIHEVCGMCTL